MSNNDLFEHKCLQKIKKLYKHTGKCDNQQRFKDIIETAMVSTPEGFNDSSPRSPTSPAPIKKSSAIKSLCLFTKILDVKKKTAILRVGSTKFNSKAIKTGTKP